MTKERIFIVEDEGIVAADLESILQGLGYQVVGIASSGEEAISKIEKTIPDLVLMDIRIKGDMDGIDTAEQIGARLNIPVTYLTAYADEKTLERAKPTMPYGYILKPFEEKDLRTAIELALYKHKMESMMATIEGWHATTLRSMPEAVVATDKNDRITFMNEMAESLVGSKMSDIYGKKFDDIFKKKSSSTDGRSVSIINKEGKESELTCQSAPIKNDAGVITGNVIILQSQKK